jgi:hypothetical protein
MHATDILASIGVVACVCACVCHYCSAHLFSILLPRLEHYFLIGRSDPITECRVATNALTLPVWVTCAADCCLLPARTAVNPTTGATDVYES